MLRRCYFMLPNVECARALLDRLLLARIEERHIHFVSGREDLPEDMPKASLFQRVDLTHSTEMGMVIGAVSGLLACLLMLLLPRVNLLTQLSSLIVCVWVGAVIGTWLASRLTSTLSDAQLMRFSSGLEEGQILLMLDLSVGQSDEIRELIKNGYALDENETIPGLMSIKTEYRTELERIMIKMRTAN